MEISIGTGYRPYPFNVNVDTSHDGAVHSINPIDSFDSDAGTTAEHEPPNRQCKPCRRNPTPRTVTTVPPAAGPPRGATAVGARRVGAGRGANGCMSVGRDKSRSLAAIIGKMHVLRGSGLVGPCVSIELKLSHACNHKPSSVGRLALAAETALWAQVTVDCVKLHKFDIESVSACAGRRTFLT